MNLRLWALALTTTALAHAASGTTDLRYAGVPADGGANCSACHSTYGGANSDPRGGVAISITDYNPGVLQTIHVTVRHPQGTRWGFQLTARVVSDETKEAGMFAALDGNAQVRCDDGSRLGTAGPCAGSREFAEHVMGPSTAAGAGFTFDVNWTPPANEVGDVKFYVAAVAANGDGTAAGDWVYAAVKTVPFTGACSLTRKPTLRTAVNGASFEAAFSSNAMLSVFGQDFQVAGRTRLAGLGDILNGQFPKQLACVAVEIDGRRVPVAYVQQDQINVQAPVFQGVGPVSLVVILNPDRPNEVRSDRGTLNGQQAAAPGFFLGAGGGIAAQFANTATLVGDPAAVPGARPAKPGDVITLYGTGFGDTKPAMDTGTIATVIAPLTLPFSVSVGGATLAASEVFYAGLSPGSISGLYQVNVRLPAVLADGVAAVAITVAGARSQAGVGILVKN